MVKNKDEYLLKVSQYIVKSCSEFNPITIKIPKVYRKGDYTVQTDGKIIRVGDKFFELEIADQIYKLLHISMHVALRHHQRAKEIYHNEQALKVWNVSTDVMVNNAINEYVEQKLRNTESFSFDQLTFNLVKNAVLDNLKEDIKKMNSEKIFSFLFKAIDSEQGLDNLDNVEQEGGNSNKGKQLEKQINKTENEFSPTEYPESSQVLQMAGLSEEDKPSDSKVQDLIWGERLKNTLKQAGNQAGNFLLNILEDLPKVKVPWDKVLRQFITARLMRERESNWKRPGRRYMAGVTKFYEPYRDRKKGVKRLALCWDISGSCFDQGTITKFVANIEVVHKATGCDFYIIPFDTQVDESQVIRVQPFQRLKDIVDFNKRQIAGGGGTDFRPPIKYAEDLHPDVIVVLTDCWGPFPNKSKIPTIWATTGDDAPWGKTIDITD